MAYTETSNTTSSAPAKFNLIKWLVRLDAAYRDASKLKKADDHILKDMGMTRRQTNTAFSR